MDSVAYKKLKQLRKDLERERNHLIKFQGGLSLVEKPEIAVDPAPEPEKTGKGSCGCDCEKQGSGMNENEIIKMIETAVDRAINRRTAKGIKITGKGVPVKSGAARASNPWLDFLKDFKVKNPTLSHREAMQQASPLYRAQK
jgi:hypothetical protein